MKGRRLAFGIALIILAIGSAGAAIVARASTFGGNALVFGLSYLAICLVHIAVHIRVATKRPAVRPVLVGAVMSNAALLGAFLLQWDRDIFAHGQGGELVLAAVLSGTYWPEAPHWWPPAWWPSVDGHEFLLFVVVSWFLVNRAADFSSFRAQAATAVAVLIPTVVALALASSMTLDRVLAENEAVRAVGGRAPTAACGTGPVPQLRSVSSSLDGALGADRVWLDLDDMGTRGPRMEVRANDVAFHGLGQLSRDGGPPVSFLTTWLVSPENKDVVRIQIVDLSSGQPVRIGARDTPDGELLDPSKPSGKPSPLIYGGYAVYYRYLQLAHTGCYRLEASWPGGSWTIGIAAGE